MNDNVINNDTIIEQKTPQNVSRDTTENNGDELQQQFTPMYDYIIFLYVSKY